MALGEARTHVRFFVILNIILGTACLLQVTQAIGNRAYNNVSETALWLFILGGAIAPTCVISVFRELHNPQQSDVVYSLPMSAKERYASRILTVFYLQLLPVIVWSGIATAVTVLLFNYAPREVDSWWIWYNTRPQEALQMFFLYVTSVLFLETVTVICAICCGRRAEMRYFTYIAAISISAAPLMIRTRLMSEMGGQVTKPGIIYFLWSFSALGDYVDTSISIWRVLLVTVSSTLISLGVIVAMFFFYRKRDAGTAGKPVVSRIFFELVILLGLVTYYTLFLFEGSPETVVAVALIIYMVIHLVTFRDILSGRKVAWWLGKFTATTVLFLFIVFVAYMTDGFGSIHYIPSRNLDGARILVSGDGYMTGYAGGEAYRRSWMRDYNDVEYMDSKEITDAEVRKVVEICQKYAASGKKSMKGFYDKLWGTESYYGFLRESDRNEAFEVKIWLPGKPEDAEAVMDQQFYLTYGQALQLVKELEETGILNIRRFWK